MIPVHHLSRTLKKYFILTLTYMGVWMFIILLSTTQLMLGADLDWTMAFQHSYSRWLGWILITPLIIWVCDQLPLNHNKYRIRNVILHIVLSVIFSFIVQILFESFFKPEHRNPRNEEYPHEEYPGGERRPPMGRSPFGGPPPRGHVPPIAGQSQSLLLDALKHIHVLIPVYWAIIGIQSTLLFARQLNLREKEAILLQSQLTSAQLEVLKLQLQPHFLFNTLNAISTLLHQDPVKADLMIGQLSTLLRAALDNQHADLVSLDREVQILEAYINIEKTRFYDRMTIELDIPTDCQKALFPPLFLQPLVENSIRHGIEPSMVPGNIWVSCKKLENQLWLEIEDNGVGQQSPGEKGWGIGLSNAEARLKTLFGEYNYHIKIAPRIGGGTAVTILIPFQFNT